MFQFRELLLRQPFLERLNSYSQIFNVVSFKIICYPLGGAEGYFDGDGFGVQSGLIPFVLTNIVCLGRSFDRILHDRTG